MILLVTGTDTGVGKTIVTAALTATALTAEATRRVAVVKPAQTGVTADEPGDLDDVRRLRGGR
jgi:dethiobiotin synthetase